MKSRVWPGVKAFDDLQTIEDMKSPMVTGTGKEGKCSRTYTAVIFRADRYGWIFR